VGHIFSTEAPCSEGKDLGISKLRKCLCNAKAVECQRQLTYNAAQGGDIGFAQRLCYERGGRTLFREVLGWSTPWQKDFDLVTLMPPKRFSSLVWCTGALLRDSQATNRITDTTVPTFHHSLSLLLF